ncbi:NAD(P)/FAD-dependent oxidoreductase [Rhizomonospora bruguierae]|uniref:NAD(P)/FAD-dependent oxidoreductase n=1 Tax=Rhizomonospora bruguierae TaxID=1581705 RepID=UPI001BD07C71|nr:FAD-dependent oxidoreductase [Micromonospora sp. NBRC 107566]
MNSLQTVVVVGAGVAGVRAIQSMRSSGFNGHLTLVGGEAGLPYDRPPLSKDFLLDESVAADITLLSSEDLDTLGVEYLSGVRVERLDPAERVLHADGGLRLPFDGAVLCPGASPRRLSCPGTELAGVRYLRTLDDAVAIRSLLSAGRRMIVVGGGFIGVEAAVLAAGLGLDVTVVDIQEMPFQVLLGRQAADLLLRHLRKAGVKFVGGRVVASFEGLDKLTTVTLNDGSRIDADLALVGIGAAPDVAWLAGTAVLSSDGIEADEFCRTAIDGVYAAGDACRWLNLAYGSPMRVEHWTNAIDQATAAAANLTCELAGEAHSRTPYRAVPYFWSSQGAMLVQFVGVRPAGCEGEMERSLQDENRWAITYRDQRGSLVGALAVNWPARAVRARKDIRSRVLTAD